jgi:hypothetical protein
VKRDVGAVPGCCPKVIKDLGNLQRELAVLKEEIRTMKPKAESFAPIAPKQAAKMPPPAPPADKGQQFSRPNGIIAHLTKKCGGNVHRCGLVNITAKTVYKSEWPPDHVAEFGARKFFNSVNEPDQWLCYDFTVMRIRPTHYSIRAWGNYNLRHWVIEGSDNGDEWVEMDRRNSNELTGKQMCTWQMAKPSDVRMVRIRQLGLNHSGDNYLEIGEFEIYGDILT